MKTTPLLFLLATLPLNSVAQNPAVIGRDSFGVECYRASQIAATSKSTNQSALVSCNRAIEEGALQSKDLIASYVNRGVVYMSMEKPKLALKDLNRALEMDKDTGEAYVNRGNLWFMAQRLPNAIADYDLALKLGIKQRHVAHLNRGIAREGLGKLEQAKEDYLAALLLIEKWPEAARRLARVEQKIIKKSSSDSAQTKPKT